MRLRKQAPFRPCRRERAFYRRLAALRFHLAQPQNRSWQFRARIVVASLSGNQRKLEASRSAREMSPRVARCAQRFLVKAPLAAVAIATGTVARTNMLARAPVSALASVRREELCSDRRDAECPRWALRHRSLLS